MRVESLYLESKAAFDALNKAYLISEAITVSESSRKTLVIAAASAFEKDVTEMLLTFADCVTLENSYCRFLIAERIVHRQYHTLFDWDQTSAARFFSNFGREARLYYDISARSDMLLSQAARDFLELGRLRNEIVHQDYISYNLSKTLDDVIGQYRSATYFTKFLARFLALAARGTIYGTPDA